VLFHGSIGWSGGATLPPTRYTGDSVARAERDPSYFDPRLSVRASMTWSTVKLAAF
jgi:hypothetical protein